jgi:hypothetical protein
MTKAAFLEAYRAEIISRYEWAKDTAKLTAFMLSVKHSIEGTSSQWANSGEALMAAWRAIGGKGKPTYKALRALPN